MGALCNCLVDGLPYTWYTQRIFLGSFCGTACIVDSSGRAVGALRVLDLLCGPARIVCVGCHACAQQ